MRVLDRQTEIEAPTEDFLSVAICLDVFGDAILSFNTK